MKKIILMIALLAMASTSFAAIITIRSSASVSTGVYATKTDALDAGLSLEQKVLSGESEQARKAVKFKCRNKPATPYIKNLNYSKGFVAVEELYVDGVQSFRSVVNFNFSCKVNR